MVNDGSSSKDLTNQQKIRLPGTYDEKNVVEVLKAQIENFSLIPF